MHLVGTVDPSFGIAPDSDDAQLEGLGEPRQTPPDTAEPNNQQRLAGKLVLALRDLSDHPAVYVAGLVVARFGQPARQREDECHGMLGDRLLVDALGACETYAASCEELLVELIRPGADRLDEAKLRRMIEEIVAQQAGENEDVGLTKPLEELFARPRLEAPAARPTR